MSDTPSFGFGKFVPGFDFLQNLAKGAADSLPQMPNLSHWVAPTLNVEELEKRIEELKAVQFWLEQNSRALAATIQALEVQKMTLATLKGMNFNMADVAGAFAPKAADSVTASVHKAGEAMAGMAQGMADAAARTVGAGAAAAGKPQAKKAPSAAAAAEAPGLVDPMQWWGSLTNQFQQIAANALKDAARQSAMDTTRHMATGLAKEAFKTATSMASQMAKPAKRRAAAPKKTSAAPAAKKAPAKRATRKSAG